MLLNCFPRVVVKSTMVACIFPGFLFSLCRNCFACGFAAVFQCSIVCSVFIYQSQKSRQQIVSRCFISYSIRSLLNYSGTLTKTLDLSGFYNVYDQKKEDKFVNLDQETLLLSQVNCQTLPLLLKAPNSRPTIICINGVLATSSNQDNAATPENSLFQVKRRKKTHDER